MASILKKIAACAVMAAIAVSTFAGCAGKKDDENAVANIDTVYIGTHHRPEDDPTWRDEITGEHTGMNPDKIKAATAALATVKEELGVDIVWKQWPNGVTQDILQTVLAGDPYCHIAILSNGFQGRVMVQNVLQPLDDYMYLFNDDPDAQWIATGKTFGHNYLLNRDLLYITDWPMVYNATMLEAIPGLKEEDGTTLYPVELYERGEWTWSKFEEYLGIIQSYYAGKTADSGKAIVPYDARYQYTAIQAIHSNGAYLYNGNDMTFDSPEAIEACEYLDRLMTNGLVNCVQSKFGSSRDPGYLQSVEAFGRGETVFTNCARWRMSAESSNLAKRGESMGIIFFPRPDDVPFEKYNLELHNDPNYGYKIAISCADSVGLLRGYDKAESELALKAYKLYKVEFYKNYGGVDSIKEYRETMVPTEAINFGVDIFHPEIGDKNLEVFQLLGSLSENEYGEAMNIIWAWGVDIFGASVYANDGSPKYAIKVKSSKENVWKSIDTIGEALKSEGATDAVAPSISQVNSNQSIVFKKGTNPATIRWEDIFTTNDNVDGKYLMKTEGASVAKLLETFCTVADNYNDDFAKVDEAIASDIDVTAVAHIVYDSLEPGAVLLKADPALEEDEEDEKEDEKIYRFLPDMMSVDYAVEISEETGEIVSGVDFDSVGKYENGIKITVTDTYGNTATKNFTAYIYDDANTVPPTLTAKEETKAIALEADTTTVDWAGGFVEEAKDVNDIDLKAFVKADVSELDVTLPGTYPVTLSVEDFAKNKSEVQIEVTVSE